MRPTLLKDRYFWLTVALALIVDLASKAQWGEIYREQTAWAGGLLLVMLALFLARLAAARLSLSLTVGLALLTAGIAGNALDVLMLDGVRDWLGWFGWRSNLADIYIWTGLFIWIWAIYSIQNRPKIGA